MDGSSDMEIIFAPPGFDRGGDGPMAKETTRFRQATDQMGMQSDGQNQPR